MSDNSCCYDAASQPLSSVNQCLEQMQQYCSPRQSIEQVPLQVALDRILAKDLVAQHPVPPYLNSAMDGYALRGEDLGQFDHFEIKGQAFAGHPYQEELGPGECVQIMTGAALPPCFDTVVMRELCAVSGSRIRFTGKVEAGENIRQIGEDLAQGALALKAGSRLSPAALGLAASLGYEQIPVFSKLKVALCSTGDEINAPGNPLPLGGIYDSNRFSLLGLLKRLGIEVIDLGIIPDTPDALEDAMREGARQADVVISSGGVSVGEADYTKSVLEKVGSVEFWRMAIRPGRPMAFGTIQDRLFFGLPGNPVAVMVAFMVVVQPLLRLLQGEEQWQPKLFPALAEEPLQGRTERLDYLRGCYRLNDAGQLVVATTGAQGSGILSSMVLGNCLIRLDEQQDQVKTGDHVLILPFADRL